MFYNRLLWYQYGKFSPRFAWRWMTASKRSLPDFLIIGAQKCGTTSLYAYLEQHPEIAGASKKEVKYFDMFSHQELDWYKAHFPTIAEKGQRLTGEATPDYLFFPGIATKVHRCMPNAKLLVLLRDPADRSYSQYRYAQRRGHETLSFADAIEAEPRRLKVAREACQKSGQLLSTHRNYREQSYVARSQYIEQLQPWFEQFDRNQFLFLTSEALQSQPQETLRLATDYLGLQSYEFRTGEKHNAAGSKPSGEALKQIESLRERFHKSVDQLTKVTGLSFDTHVVN
ncbi:MAG: sulfotransferase domain-containing protein [Erythrobacter sp.]